MHRERSVKFDELYSSYEDEELDVKTALEAIGINSVVAAEAAKIYQQGKAQDLIYAEKALAAGSSFDTVARIMRSNIQRRLKSRPKFDTKLRDALKKSKKLPDLQYDYQAHHIVAKGDHRAKQAASILAALGIDIDDPANGVFLPANNTSKQNGSLKQAYIHGPVHTKAYHSNVSFQVVTLFRQTASMSQDDRKEEMLDLLDEIADQLQNGSYPIHSYIPGAERFA